MRMPSFLVSVQVGAGVGASPTKIPANANVLLSVNTIANVIAVIVFFIFFLLKFFYFRNPSASLTLTITIGVPQLGGIFIKTINTVATIGYKYLKSFSVEIFTIGPYGYKVYTWIKIII